MPLLSSDALAQGRAQHPQTDLIYETPTLKKISQLYWAISKFDISNNWAVDNFMLINECEIYKKHFHNEFEWKDVREAGRQYIRDNVVDFPVRFEIEQPLRLADYDLDQEIFKIWQPYKIEGARLFEVLPPNNSDEVCGQTKEIEGYPKALIMELTRPFILDHIKMTPTDAKAYIKLKEKKARRSSNREMLYKTRDAYLVLKTKVFSFKKEEHNVEGGRMVKRTSILAAIEGYDIYADRKRQHLLYSEVRRKRDSNGTSAERELKKRFDARIKKLKAKEAAKKEKEAAAKAAAAAKKAQEKQAAP